MTGWPSSLDKGSEKVRAVKSGEEPPGKPTTMRTGLVGQAAVDAAKTELVAEAATKAVPAANMVRRAIKERVVIVR